VHVFSCKAADIDDGPSFLVMITGDAVFGGPTEAVALELASTCTASVFGSKYWTATKATMAVKADPRMNHTMRNWTAGCQYHTRLVNGGLDVQLILA